MSMEVTFLDSTSLTWLFQWENDVKTCKIFKVMYEKSPKNFTIFGGEIFGATSIFGPLL